MGFFSSKTLIQAHALFLFIVAVYLVISPTAITDSDIIFILGEAMQIDFDPSLSPQIPFAVCAILLIGEALFDLIIVRKLPQPEDVITPQNRRRDDSGYSPVLAKPKETISPLLVQLATLYNEVWTFLAGARFCFYFVIALCIYQSKPGGWGLGTSTQAAFQYDDTQLKSGLGQLKNRVVFTYAFMEMMFWLWTLSNVREERRDVADRLAKEQAAQQQRNLD